MNEAEREQQKPTVGFRDRPPGAILPAPAPPVAPPPEPEAEEFFLFTIDDWWVNTFVPPLLLAVVWLVNLSPLGFLLQGFHVWVHEFGAAAESRGRLDRRRIYREGRGAGRVANDPPP